MKKQRGCTQAAGPRISTGNACGVQQFGKISTTFNEAWTCSVWGSRAAGLASRSSDMAMGGWSPPKALVFLPLSALISSELSLEYSSDLPRAENDLELF